MKNDLAAAIVQIRRSEELNKKHEQEYQETLAAMKRRIQELEGKNLFSFIEFSYVLNRGWLLVGSLKARAFLRRGRQPEENISRAKKVLSLRFLYYSFLMEKRYLAM